MDSLTALMDNYSWVIAIAVAVGFFAFIKFRK